MGGVNLFIPHNTFSLAEVCIYLTANSSHDIVEKSVRNLFLRGEGTADWEYCVLLKDASLYDLNS